MARPKYQSTAQRIAAATFVVLFLVIPIAVLASIPLGILVEILLALALLAFGAGFLASERFRGGVRDAAKSLLAAGVILGIIHFSGVMDPFYRREGWLILDLEMEIEPLRVAPGEPLTYTLSTTNTGVRAALKRRIRVDDVPYEGVFVYGRLPDLGGARFPIVGTPIASTYYEDDPGSDVGDCTIIYATPGLPELSPENWDWSETYTPGPKVIGAITSDGETHRGLEAGETLRLQYAVGVPEDHPDGKVHHVRAALGYRDPQWATHHAHDLWFKFEEVVVDSSGGV